MNTKGKKALVIVLSVVLIVAAGFGIFYYYLSHRTAFQKNTTLNGLDVSEKTPDEVVDLMNQEFEKIQVTLTEQGEADLESSASDLGFYVEKDLTRGLVQEALDIQNGKLMDMALSVIKGLTFHVDVPTSVDETVFTSKVNAAVLAKERIPAVNAALKQQKDGSYAVVPEVPGTEFADEDLQYEVRTQIGKALVNASDVNSALSTGKIELEFPEQIYLPPEILSTDKDLNAKCDIYNLFCKAEITYQYGSQTEVLNWDTIKDWVIIENGTGRIDNDQAWAYVEGIAAKYNTRYHERTFSTARGGKVTFSSGLNEYGYTVNEDAEFGQLLNDIAANTSVTREPVYYKTNSYGNPYYYHREGTDDLAGTYVEVDLSAQHLWFFKNGAVIVESDLVSGCVAKGHETATGVFPLAYKKSPDVLVGSNANDGYRTKVEYWMPFYEGQGLHDATWRGSFGGNIYQTNGSHGCVNLPLNAAGAIYQNIEPGMAIIIHK